MQRTKRKTTKLTIKASCQPSALTSRIYKPRHHHPLTITSFLSASKFYNMKRYPAPAVHFLLSTLLYTKAISHKKGKTIKI